MANSHEKSIKRIWINNFFQKSIKRKIFVQPKENWNRVSNFNCYQFKSFFIYILTFHHRFFSSSSSALQSHATSVHFFLQRLRQCSAITQPTDQLNFAATIAVDQIFKGTDDPGDLSIFDRFIRLNSIKMWPRFVV